MPTFMTVDHSVDVVACCFFPSQISHFYYVECIQHCIHCPISVHSQNKRYESEKKIDFFCMVWPCICFCWILCCVTHSVCTIQFIWIILLKCKEKKNEANIVLGLSRTACISICLCCVGIRKKTVHRNIIST